MTGLTFAVQSESRAPANCAVIGWEGVKPQTEPTWVKGSSQPRIGSYCTAQTWPTFTGIRPKQSYFQLQLSVYRHNSSYSHRYMHFKGSGNKRTLRQELHASTSQTMRHLDWALLIVYEGFIWFIVTIQTKATSSFLIVSKTYNSLICSKGNVLFSRSLLFESFSFSWWQNILNWSKTVQKLYRILIPPASKLTNGQLQNKKKAFSRTIYIMNMWISVKVYPRGQIKRNTA